MASSKPNYSQRMKEFPCNFNLILPQEIGLSRLKVTKYKLICELASGGNKDIGHHIRQKNMLTWVLFRMDESEEAQELNDEVMEITNRRNITALGNRVYIRVRSGDEFEAEDCLKRLDDMKSEDNYDELLAEAKAEQAYCHSRLGDHYHISSAIQLFTEALKVCPQNSLWKLGLGLMYRRMTNSNLFCSGSDRANIDHYVKMAAQCLFDVGDDESATDEVRSMAYAQLVSLRQFHPSSKFPQYEDVFQGKNIHQLCEKALEKGSTIPSVLSSCGRSLKAIDIEKAIMYLEKSVEIKKENSIGYHHLGLSYIEKASSTAQETNKPCSPDQAENSCTFVREKVERQLLAGGEHSYGQHDTSVEHSTKTSQAISERDPEFKSGHVNIDSVIGSGTQNSRIARNVDTASPKTEKRKQQSAIGCSNEKWSFCDDEDRDVASDAAQTERPSRYVNYCGVTQQNRGIGYRGRFPHHAGIQRESGIGDLQSLSAPKISLETYVNTSIKNVPLNIHNDLVKKGVDALKQSIKVSRDENLPAVFDLAQVQKRAGQLREALSNFNKVVNSPWAPDHKVVVISAFEEAGLCYLKLSNQADAAEKSEYNEKAKEKLTKAVSFAVELATTLPELKGCENDIWVAFRELNSNLDSEDPSPRIAKEKIRLLQLVKAHNELLPAIQKLLELDEHEINNEDTVETILASYLSLGKYEDALAFLNMLRLKATITGSETWTTGKLFHLRIKILLSTIYERLNSDAYPQQLFQQLFEMTFGHCAGADNSDNEVADSPDSKVTRDVLLVFDEEELSDASKGCSTRVGRHFKHVLSDVFGLDAEENLRGCCSFQDFEETEMERQLEEMMKYQVVMIVMDDEERSKEFQTLLERIPYLEKTNPPTIIVYDAGNKKSHDVMPVLKPYRRKSAQDIGSIQVASAGARGGAMQATESTHVKDIFQGGLESVMELFCFIIGQPWPCQ